MNILVGQAKRLVETTERCIESQPAPMVEPVEESKDLVETILEQAGQRYESLQFARGYLHSSALLEAAQKDGVEVL